VWAWCGEARRGMAGRGCQWHMRIHFVRFAARAGQGRVRLGSVRQAKAGSGQVGWGMVGLGQARPGRAGYGEARVPMARTGCLQVPAMRGWAGRGEARQARRNQRVSNGKCQNEPCNHKSLVQNNRSARSFRGAWAAPGSRAASGGLRTEIRKARYTSKIPAPGIPPRPNGSWHRRLCHERGQWSRPWRS